MVRKGKNYNAFLDIEKALEMGAIVLHEDKNEKRGIYVFNLMKKLHDLMEVFYKDISDQFTIVGVCGTSGKSSVVSYLYEMMKHEPCMKIGTHFIESMVFTFEHENTTPNEIALMHLFHLALENKIKYIFMEVSSHAIDLNRIAYIHFDTIIYTNIERDHLDYHKSVMHYRYTKYKLMKYLKGNGFVIANKDALYFNEMKDLCKSLLISYGQKAAHFHMGDLSLSIEGSSFYVNRFYFRTSLLSEVNIYNLCACIALFRMWKISYYDIYKRILNLKGNEGRLEIIYKKDFTVMVDYAHNSHSFYEIIRFLSTLKYHRLILVVGCGGEREKEKRSEIGYYASNFCDICIFCEDNSRYENVDEIMKEMSIRVQKEAILIADREKAIEYAIKMAENNDIILVSGKGDEQFLLREGKKIPFNDKQKILEILE